MRNRTSEKNTREKLNKSKNQVVATQGWGSGIVGQNKEFVSTGRKKRGECIKSARKKPSKYKREQKRPAGEPRRQDLFYKKGPIKIILTSRGGSKKEKKTLSCGKHLGSAGGGTLNRSGDKKKARTICIPRGISPSQGDPKPIRGKKRRKGKTGRTFSLPVRSNHIRNRKKNATQKNGKALRPLPKRDKERPNDDQGRGGGENPQILHAK